MKSKGHIPSWWPPSLAETFQAALAGGWPTLPEKLSVLGLLGILAAPRGKKKKNLDPEPPCGHVETGQAGRPAAAPALPAREQGTRGAQP